ncbi:hypothetical protein H1R17_02575 [Flavobacterium sp. xlx-214]|uniref:hypothetical protein n=1 Tax=unclassified Flavobacterium TaxID=196869 RepID=UPI0013D18F89|nr:MULTISPECIES: hypothetical protein [unclassified Flavobacterium]MBA5793400.1 hypothetical protein [Flavobacterium sp. xlx-221]QMI84040.1 hypothetical protein H1R17_02575 [Flavobacterium sp. xlx-214]
MRINKLLFFLLALISLNSCVEYVDNGVLAGGNFENEKIFRAELKPTSAKYVGDTFEFQSMLTNVDVTKSTKFKVNGAAIKGNTYIPYKEGDISVVATMENYTATFKFNVLKEGDQPEPPAGNRIEYGGKSYPVSDTMWVLSTNDKNQVLIYDVHGTDCTVWVLMSLELDNDNKPLHQFTTIVYVPLKANDEIAFPNESPSALQHIKGSVVINGTEVFKTTDVSYTFAGTGNTAPADPLSMTPPWSGTANFTALATGASSGNSAQLFWEGDYVAIPQKISAKPVIKSMNINTNFKFETKYNVRVLNLKK